MAFGFNPFTQKLDKSGGGLKGGSSAGNSPVFPNVPTIMDKLAGLNSGIIYPVTVGDGLTLDSNILTASPTTTELTLTNGVVTWNEPTGKGVLVIPAPRHAAKLILTSANKIHAFLAIRTNLHCLLSFGGDVDINLDPISLAPHSDVELEISRGSSSDKIMVTVLKSTYVPGDESASGSPVLHLNPSKWKGLASTTSRWVNKWYSVVGSNYAESTGVGSTRPTFGFNDPNNNGATVSFASASSQIMPLHSAIDSGTGYTILVAFKPTAVPVAFGMLTSGANHYFGVNSNRGISFYDGAAVLTSPNLEFGTTNTGWCIAAIRQGATSKDIFINLTRVATASGTASPLQMSHIGCFTNTGYNFNGSIGEVLAYSSRLSDSDIATELTRMCKRWKVKSRFIPCDGNSLTAGTNDGEETGTWDWPTRLATLSPFDWVINFGVSGQNTAQMESDATTQIDVYGHRIDGGKNICFAWEIGNHLASGASVATAQSTFQTYCTNRQTAGFDVAVIDVPYRNVTSNLTDANLDTINAWLLANYATFGKYLIRLSQIPEINTKTDQTFRTTTTIHYYSPGYYRIALENYKAIAQP